MVCWFGSVTVSTAPQRKFQPVTTVSPSPFVTRSGTRPHASSYTIVWGRSVSSISVYGIPFVV